MVGEEHSVEYILLFFNLFVTLSENHLFYVMYGEDSGGWI